MVFHPVAQVIVKALQARRDPPPPQVPTLPDHVLRRHGNEILHHPARREIAESLLVIAMRLDVLGFYAPRDQLLWLAGCGLAASQISDVLQRRNATQSGAHELMAKARSTPATPLEKMLKQGSVTTSSEVSIIARQRALQRQRGERLQEARRRRRRLQPQSMRDTPTVVEGSASQRRHHPGDVHDGNTVVGPQARGPNRPDPRLSLRAKPPLGRGRDDEE